MDDALYYLSVNRQLGLKRELDTIANNIANVDTPGFRREGIVFSEFVSAAAGTRSISMADTGARYARSEPGSLRITGAPLDLAIDGPGHFLVDGETGPMLTRGGSFQRSPEGLLVTSGGELVLDAGGAPIFLPAEAASVVIGADGTLSIAGVEEARIGVYSAPPGSLVRVAAGAFRPTEGYEEVPGARVVQGAVEGSNVEAVEEISRLISVTRAYERVQALISNEDDRVRDVIRTLREPV